VTTAGARSDRGIVARSGPQSWASGIVCQAVIYVHEGVSRNPVDPTFASFGTELWNVRDW